MSQYDKIDHLIVEAIKSGASKFETINADAVNGEAVRLRLEAWKAHRSNAKTPFRIIDSRLQALRKRGLIEHAKGRGWIAKEAA